MRKLGIAATTVAIAGGATFVYAQNELETVLDLAVQEMMSEGATVTYDDRRIGLDKSVEYTNLVITNPDGDMSISTDWIKGVPSSDDPAFVTITVAETIKIEGTEEGENIDFEVRSTGLELVTNGLLFEAFDTKDVTIAFTADTFIVDGGDPESDTLRDVLAEIEDLDFALLISETNKTVDGHLNAGKYDVKYDFTMEGQSQIADQSVEFLEATFDFDIPDDDEDAFGYLTGEKSASLKMAAGSSAFKNSVEQEGVEFDMEGTSGPSTVLIEMVDGRVVYDVQGDAFNFLLTPGAALPIPPFDVAMQEVGMKLVLPLNSAEEADDMVLDILFADLTVGEGLWSMIDPGKTISRDPATLDIDLVANVQVDALKGVMTGGGDNPFEFTTINNVAINQVLLAIGGASAQAQGELDMNNSGPFPMPVGAINVEINGAQTLSGQLVDLGLVDQMQVGMMMGMMMAFAKPGEEADQFVSEIEFTENGSITANGQPIK